MLRNLLIFLTAVGISLCLLALLSVGDWAAEGAVSAPSDTYGGWKEQLQPGNARACINEDSGWMCVWDARHRGNGEGDSFARDRRGRVHVISHRTAHRALNG